MKISIIVPVYNSELYLADCMESILKQTYQDFEIILINDGSKDGSGSICDEYALRDPRIRVVHQENRGVSCARNVGLSMVTGDAVSFIDSDDTLEPNMYQLLINVMREHEADISHCGYKHIVRDEIRFVHDTKRIIPQSRHEALECFVSGRLFGGGLWNKLFRFELISHIQFNENLKINEDVLFNFEAFMKAEKTVFADFALYNYVARFGTSAVFTTPDEKKIKDSCKVSKYIYECMKGTDLNDVAAERYIRSLRGYYEYCSKYSRDLCKAIATAMQEVYATTNQLDRNIKITVILIKYCPWIYCIVHTVYTKLRKPQWEARKD